MAEPSNICIAIDGYSACGKSTLAKALSQKLAFIHLDTGSMYRSVTFDYLASGLPLKDYIDQKLPHLKLDVQIVNGSSVMSISGLVLTKQLRSPEVDQHVSEVAAQKEVRQILVQQQKQIASNGNVILDGRDIGTNVLPNAELKLFLTADIDVRAARRQQDLARMGIHHDLDEIKSNLKSRDFKDMNRLESPLQMAEDAVLIDNTNLNKKEQLEISFTLAQCRM